MIALGLIVLLRSPLTIQVTPDPYSGAVEPQLAIDSDDRVYLAFGCGDETFVSISGDDGKSFSSPIKVGAPGKLSLGMRRGPRVAAHKGTVTVTATYGAIGGGRDGDILAFRSIDHGRTWSTGVRVNDVKGSAREGLHAMAVAPDGTLACAWLDLRDKGTRLYMSTSRDGGGTWVPNTLVYASPSGTICQCCHPSVTFDSKGRLFVMFRNALDGNRDMYLTSSGDHRTFDSPKKLGRGTWGLDVCPMDGGMVAVGGRNEIFTMWRRQDTIFGTDGDAAETSFGTGKQPWVAVNADGIHRVWLAGREVKVKNGELPATTLAENGSDPVIACSASSRLTIAAWADRGIRARIVSPK